MSLLIFLLRYNNTIYYIIRPTHYNNYYMGNFGTVYGVTSAVPKLSIHVRAEVS